MPEVLEANPPPGVKAADINPVVVDVGQLVGLLVPDPIHESDYTLNQDWFKSPFAATEDGIKQNPKRLAELLGEVLGAVGGNAHGIPAKNPALLGSWYPIPNPAKDGAPTDLNVVAYPDPHQAGAMVFGFGALLKFEYNLAPEKVAAPAISGPKGIRVQAWALAPLLRIGPNGASAVVSQKGYPLSFGIAVAGTNGAPGAAEPIISAGEGVTEFSFNGVKFGAEIDLSVPSADVSIVVLSLKLPGEQKGVDRTLADLEALTGSQIMEVASALFISALSDLASDSVPDIAEKAGYLLPVVGLSKFIPGQGENATVPQLPWWELFNSRESVTTPFIEWFTKLTSDTATTRNWLFCVGKLLGVASLKKPSDIVGSGTRESPLAVRLIDLSESVGALAFTSGTSVDKAGIRHFYPGLTFTAKDFVLADGSPPPAVLRVQADLELAEFKLTTTPQIGGLSSLKLSTYLTLENGARGQPLFEGEYPANSGDHFVFGRMEAGLSLDATANIQPLFQLVDVEFPGGKFPTIDLMSPDELATAAEGALNQAIQTGFKTLFGLADGDKQTYLATTAAVIGVLPPPQAAVSWPAEAPQPPFGTVAEIEKSIKDPIGAVAGYLRALLDSDVQIKGVDGADHTAFTYVLWMFTDVLREATAGTPEGIHFSGEGTEKKPWKIALSENGSDLPANLTIFKVADPQNADVTQLYLGAELDPALTAASTKVQLTADVCLVRLDLPRTGSAAAVGAQWLPGLQLALGVPDGFKTAKVANSYFKLDNALVSGSWSREKSWGWRLLAEKPTFNIDGKDLLFATTLDWSDQCALQDLVTQAESGFANVLVGTIGVALTHAQTRAGAALTGALGLLPDPTSAPNFPRSLKSSWEAATLRPLALEDLKNPWPAVLSKLENNYASQANAKAVLGLLGWVFNPESEEPPSVGGDGSADSPYKIPLGGSNFELLTWFVKEGRLLGLGLGRTDQFRPTENIQVTVETQLEAGELSLADGSWRFGDGVVPSLAFRTTLANPNPTKNLFEAGDPTSDLYVSIQQLQLGFRLCSDSKGLVVVPLVDLVEARLPGRRTAKDYEFFQLGEFTSDVLQAFESALNQVVGYAVDELLKVESRYPAFRQSYDLLSLLGLTIPVKADATKGFGINTGGWNGLVADPLGYLKNQVLQVLADPGERKQFVEFVSSTLGIPFSEVPQVVNDALYALGFLGDAEHGYPINPGKLLQLASNPFQALRESFEELVNDEAARKQLASVLTNDLDAPPFPESTGMFAYKTYADGRIELSIVEGKVTIGEFVGISGTATFNIVEETLSAEIAVTIDAIRLALVSSFTYKIGAGDPTLGVEVQWTNDGLPAAGTLTLCPFEESKFLNNLADLAPGYVLSTVVGQVMEGWILNQGYPVVDKVFEILGLASVDTRSKKLQVRQLQGLLKDPEGWFLSKTVFGSDGSLNLVKLQSDLEALGALNASSKKLDLGIRPYTDSSNLDQKGLQVYGFPYGFGANLSSDAKTAACFTVQTEKLHVASGKASIDRIRAGVTLGPDYQPGIIGELKISGALPDGGSLFVDTCYDTKMGFELTVGQEGRHAPLVLPLYPFAGWGALANALRTVAAQLLIDNVPKLVDALKDKYRGKQSLVKFLGDLETAGSALEVSALASGIAGLDPFTEGTVLKEALSWLLARFESEAAGRKTAEAIQALLSSVITSGLGVDGGALTYRPSDTMPLKLYLGTDQPKDGGDLQLGLWAGLTLPDNQIVRADIERAGIGFEVAKLQAALKQDGNLVFDPKFVFGVGLQIPVENDASGVWGPRLDFAYVPPTQTVSAHFAGHFDPLYNSQGDGHPSSLSRELFPNFFATNTHELETWLLGVVKQVLPRYASAVVLNTEAVRGWLGKDLISGSNLTAFKILEGAALIKSVGSPKSPAYILTPISELEELTPKKFVGGLLYAAFSSKIQILKGDNYGLWIEPESEGSSNLGVRVQASDLTIGSLSNLKIQLGAEDRDWIEKTGGQKPPALPGSGLSFYVPVPENGGTREPEFEKVRLNLVNVGIDYAGKGGKPLVDLSRFQVGSVKPRVLLTLDFSKDNPVGFGGSFTAADVAISLAPNKLSSSTGGNNEVAQNLVGGGSDSSDEKNPKNKNNPPTNPGFSLVTGYWRDFYLNFLDAEGKPKPQLWFPVQRAFGPIYANKIGVGWEDDSSKKYFDLLFDGTLSLAAFQLYLKELSIGVPIHDANDPSFGITNYKSYSLDLAGFDLTFQGGPVALDGGFLKTTDNDGVVAYTGFITMKAASFSLFGAGSYGTVKNNPSLFVFAALNAPLGGVPAFFINGVAAGFAYNRGLKVPPITGVQKFPLVKGAIQGTLKSDSPEDANQALEELVDAIYPEIGQDWLAAGIKFTSFELLDCFALLFIQFGRRIEFDLLGVASLPMPKGAGDNAVAYAELALKVVISPTEGIVSVEARLTPNSYVIAKECKLTGGFAFFLWLKDITVDGVAVSAGEFVVTLGGFHPAFQKPKFYPDPPRLGLYWPIELGVGSLTIDGGAYFALVPTAVMAGGYLHVNFKAGPIRAWVDAQADFIISWKPFYFDVGISVEIGVAFEINIGGVNVTLKASIGAKLHLLGPPTHGTAEVDLLFVSFTIPIGDQNPEYNPSRDTLDWSNFAKDFLPPETPEKESAERRDGGGCRFGSRCGPSQSPANSQDGGRTGFDQRRQRRGLDCGFGTVCDPHRLCDPGHESARGFQRRRQFPGRESRQGGHPTDELFECQCRVDADAPWRERPGQPVRYGSRLHRHL